jgi:hypothetical protein
MSADISTLLINYGLAGVVIYIFYRLISNELRELKEEVAKLREAIEKLTNALKREVKNEG